MVKTASEEFDPILRRDVPLGTLNTWGTGGTARLVYEPETPEQTVRLLNRMEGEYLVIGRGSNLWFPGGILSRPLIRICGGPERIVLENGRMRAWAGSGLSAAATMAAREGLGGLEPLSRIPGTLGGAVWMNAGAHGREIHSLLHSVSVWDGGDVREIPAAGIQSGYRYSSFMETGQVLLSVNLDLYPEEPQILQENMEKYRRARASQPAGRSAGSVFRNPPGDSAGRLIEACGLKGKRIGGAVVSEVHANFIINDGQATAEDIRQLMELCEIQVLREFGIRLIREVRMVEP
jgi:UDP-N-acetylmuramate dehydrogenase